MNKKGGIFEIFTAMALFLAVTLIAFISARVGGDVLSGIRNANVTNFSTTSGQIVNDTIQAGIDTSLMGDSVFLIIFAGYILAMIITSLATNFHPAFFFIFLILSLLGIVIAAPISNAYLEISQAAAFSSFVTGFPVINMVMGNLPFVIMLISGLLMLVTYARQRTI